MISHAENAAAIPQFDQVILPDDEALVTTPLVNAVTQLKQQAEALDQNITQNEQNISEQLEGLGGRMLGELPAVLAYARFVKAKQDAMIDALTELTEVHTELRTTGQAVLALDSHVAHVHGTLRTLTAQHAAVDSRKRQAYEEAQTKHAALVASDAHSDRYLKAHQGTEDAINYAYMDYEARPAQLQADHTANSAFATLAIEKASLEVEISKYQDESAADRSRYASLKPPVDRLLQRANALVERYNSLWSELNQTSLAHFAVEWHNRGERQPLKPAELTELFELIGEFGGHTRGTANGRHAHAADGRQHHAPAVKLPSLVARPNVPVRTPQLPLRKFGLNPSRNDNWRAS